MNSSYIFCSLHFRRLLVLFWKWEKNKTIGFPPRIFIVYVKKLPNKCSKETHWNSVHSVLFMQQMTFYMRNILIIFAFVSSAQKKAPDEIWISRHIDARKKIYYLLWCHINFSFTLRLCYHEVFRSKVIMVRFDVTSEQGLV